MFCKQFKIIEKYKIPDSYYIKYLTSLIRKIIFNYKEMSHADPSDWKDLFYYEERYNTRTASIYKFRLKPFLLGIHCKRAKARSY